MFANTLNLVREIGIIYAHVFPYSARAGTPAAKMPQVPKEIRKTRAANLREAGAQNLQEYLKTQVGKTAQVLVEKEKTGRTEHFAMVELDKVCVAGSIVEAKITGADTGKLFTKCSS